MQINLLWLNVLQIFIASSIFFVWVVRYENIIEEFKNYNLPNWFRDFVGILKLTLAVMLIIGIYDSKFKEIATIGLLMLMFSAIATHIKTKSQFLKIIPSLFLFLASLLLFIS